jgi:hypothetical protein
MLDALEASCEQDVQKKKLIEKATKLWNRTTGDKRIPK